MEITLNLWKRPDSYYGAEWPDYYVFLDQHRDSDSLTRSNFITAMKLIGGESDTVQIVRENHWAVGWVEWIAIHKSDNAAIAKAQEIIDKIDTYPVLDETHWSNLEYDEATAYWQSMRLCDRVELCKDAEISIFSARHEWIPQDDSGFIFERLTTN